MATPLASTKLSYLFELLLVLGLASPVGAQPPERVRVDLGVAMLSAPKLTGHWFSGSFAPAPGQAGPVDLLVLLDLSTSVNISSRVSSSVSLPLALTKHSGGQATPALDGGIGDAHAELSVGALDERRYAPGLSLVVGAGAPTASLSFMGTGLWRWTTGASVSKSFHPRFSVNAYGSFSRFVEKRAIMIAPVKSLGAGVTIGITRASVLSLHLDEFAGGQRKNGTREVFPATRDFQASLGITRYSRGRPRVSLLLSGGGLRNSPVFIVAIRSAILSR
jgi:hypothetical protein